MTSYMNIMKTLEDELNRLAEPYGNVDMVNEPPHYNSSNIECINAMRAMVEGAGRTTPSLLLAECIQVSVAVAIQERERRFRKVSGT